MSRQSMAKTTTATTPPITAWSTALGVPSPARESEGRERTGFKRWPDTQGNAECSSQKRQNPCWANMSTAPCLKIVSTLAVINVFGFSFASYLAFKSCFKVGVKQGLIFQRAFFGIICFPVRGNETLLSWGLFSSFQPADILTATRQNCHNINNLDRNKELIKVGRWNISIFLLDCGISQGQIN